MKVGDLVIKVTNFSEWHQNHQGIGVITGFSPSGFVVYVAFSKTGETWEISKGRVLCK
tara:strand:- start:605 stop:778 length:174 start_codon:yes stop_codon:yes gene_type:complete